MRTVKLILVGIAVLVVGYLAYSWTVKIENPPPPPSSENIYIPKIERKIDALKNSNTASSHASYTEIRNDIIIFNREKKISNGDKEIFLKNLEYAYFEKFIDEAFRLFTYPTWNPDKLRFINSETNRLRNSPFLEQGSQVNNKLNEIRTILDKYYEIDELIRYASTFHNQTIDIDTKFDIVKAKRIITRATNYITNNLDNQYVNRCFRLHSQLREIRRTIYQIHLQHVKDKVDYWYGKWNQYASHQEYYDKLYYPIYQEIDLLSNEQHTYGISDSTFAADINPIRIKWRRANSEAIAYFNSIKTYFKI
jgi:hypothetical protein